MNETVDPVKVLSTLREKINANFMEDGFGLQQLVPRAWEDYICPESSNFTFDVEKIMRDFTQTRKIQDRIEAGTSKNEKEDFELIDAIQTRTPHVLVLHGKGGVGKSAFPVHLAGLLGLDVWDFNVNASHSKWVGEGSERMRESIKKIMAASHIVIRIDEYDRAMGSTDAGGGGMHQANKQVESEFMNWLQNAQDEGLFQKQNIFIILTTNHKENITGPLLRSGRADLVIDIDNFDASSIKETFKTCSRRMYNRGIKVIGYYSEESLQNAINSLELDEISELCTEKGFTVRDVEMLILEMAGHAFYSNQGEKGLAWNSENFIAVLKKSQGSTRANSTGELILGDRAVLRPENEEVEEDKQEVFGFEADHIADKTRINDIDGFVKV